MDFDLVRISKAKKEVDLCANTVREMFDEGLPKYEYDTMVFFSKSELAAHIRKGKPAKKQCPTN